MTIAQIHEIKAQDQRQEGDHPDQCCLGKVPACSPTMCCPCNRNQVEKTNWQGSVNEGASPGFELGGLDKCSKSPYKNCS